MDSLNEVDPGRLGERLEALPGIARLRETARGVDAYLVGGAVRDLLLGEPRADLDVVVEGDVAPLATELGGELREHERFSTASVRDGDLHVDLAISRAESYERPGALPEVRPAPLADDLARRDFTINAMAVPLAGEPELIDPHGGLDDIRTGMLRVLHPGSFVDDPTRGLRAARYAARFGFELESETGVWLRESDLGTVSDDRVVAELRKLAAEPAAARGFALAAEWGLIDLRDESPALIRNLDATIADPDWGGIADRVDAILLVVRERDADARRLAEAEADQPSSATRLARDRSGEELAIARGLGAEWLDDYVREWRHVELEIDGRDLIEAGVPEGPAVGRGLEAALAAKLDGELSGREAELERALRAARESD